MESYSHNVHYGPYGQLALGEKYITEGEPEMDFFGQRVHLDLGIPAGPLVNARAVKAALDLGWDIVTYKTVRSRKYAVNGFPNVFPIQLDGVYTPEIAEKGIQVAQSLDSFSSLTNSFGVPSLSPQEWIPDATDAVSYARDGQVVIASFQGTPKGDGDVDSFIEDHFLTARYAASTGAKILEFNGSCPNEGEGHPLLCLDYKTSGRVAEAIRNEVGRGIRLLMKICYFPDQELLKRFVDAVGPFVDGFTAINTMSARILDHANNPAFGIGRERAGVSGEPIRPYGLDMVARLTNLGVKAVGVGGVFNVDHYREYKERGALGVLSAAGSLSDPEMAMEIKRDLGMKVVQVV